MEEGLTLRRIHMLFSLSLAPLPPWLLPSFQNIPSKPLASLRHLTNATKFAQGALSIHAGVKFRTMSSNFFLSSSPKLAISSSQFWALMFSLLWHSQKMLYAATVMSLSAAIKICWQRLVAIFVFDLKVFVVLWGVATFFF